MTTLKRKGYKNNPRLRRAGETFEYTAEQIQEIFKCANDPIYFIRNWVKIVNVDKGLMNLEMYDWQEEAVIDIIENRFVIGKIARQAGKSTIVIAVMLWYILFNENFKCLIAAQKEGQAKELLARIKMSYEHLPLWMQSGIKDWSKTDIKLENGSEIMAVATSAGGVRGTTRNFVLLDEFAIVERGIQEEFFTSAFPIITSGESTKLVIISTPKGVGDKFYEIWQGSIKGKNEYKRIDVAWDKNPGRDEKFKEETIKAFGKHAWRGEYECEFLGSNLTLIDGDHLTRLGIDSIDPVFVSDDKAMCVFQEPIKGHKYIITVDVARGVGGDSSAFSVIDASVDPAMVVATYASNTIRPVMFPQIVYQTANHYNMAQVLIETNDLGEDIADDLHWELEYENILTVKPGKNGKMPTLSFAGADDRGSSFGLKMTSPVKKVGCSNLKTLIEKNKLIIPDLRVVNELSNFIEKGQSYAADKGKHDDLTMSLVLYAWLSGQESFKEMMEVNLDKSIISDGGEEITKSMVPSIYVTTGIHNFYSDFDSDDFFNLANEDKEIIDDILSRYVR